MKFASALLASALILAPVAAYGEDAHGHAHADHAMQGTEKSEAAKAFEVVNAKMHKDMAIELTGDADVDFVRGMIPHHQGAIDMAKVVLEYGKDPEIRKLAEEVIKAQDSEIAFMKAWLAKRGK